MAESSRSTSTLDGDSDWEERDAGQEAEFAYMVARAFSVTNQEEGSSERSSSDSKNDSPVHILPEEFLTVQTTTGRSGFGRSVLDGFSRLLNKCEPTSRSRGSRIFQKASQIDQDAAPLGMKDGKVSKQNNGPYVILTEEEVEPWQRFPHISTGYRKSGMTAWQCLVSMTPGATQLNNESLNAWTMLIAAAAGLYLFSDSYERAQPQGWDATPFWIFLMVQLLHCPFSVGYHTFMSISPSVAHRWRQVDLCLILFLNVGATFALSYFTLSWVACLSVTTCSLLCATTLVGHILEIKMGLPLDRSQVVLRVVGTALPYYCVVIYRGLMTAAMESNWMCTELITAVCLLLCHFIGGTIYALHWPQRSVPRIFDIIGHSHCLMHVVCFVIYVCGYPYLELLHSKRHAWSAAPGPWQMQS